jgi:hypothetical protein
MARRNEQEDERDERWHQQPSRWRKRAVAAHAAQTEMRAIGTAYMGSSRMKMGPKTSLSIAEHAWNEARISAPAVYS